MTDLTKPVSRRCATALTPMFGGDRGRRIVITLRPGDGKLIPDLIELRPHGTRRAESVAALDVYSWAMKCRVNRGQLEKAREKKAKKDATRKTRALDREIRQLARKEGQA